jgi:hypothetical protein
VLRYDDGYPFTPDGAITDSTPSGGTLRLGNRFATVFETVLNVTDASSFAMTATSADYYVVQRYAGSVLMLCDPTTQPGSTKARYVSMAAVVESGGHAYTNVTDTASLAGKTFYAMGNCSYLAPIAGPQFQNTAHDSNTLRLTFDANGDVFRSDYNVGPIYSAANFNLMLGGTYYNNWSYGAFRFNVNGVERIVIVERNTHDEINVVDGFVRLWLPE